MDFRLERVRPSSDLSALRYTPSRARSVQVVLTHGMTASAAGLDILSSYLAAHGFPVLALDLPGHKLGCSGGILDSFEAGVGALQTACDWVIAQDVRPIVLGGHSLGGALSLVLADRTPSVIGAFAIAVGTPELRTSPVGRALRNAREDYVNGAGLETLLAGMQGALSKVSDLGQRPVLVVGALQDAVVSRRAVEAWSGKIQSSLQIEWIEASHQDAAVAARVVVSRWLEATHPQ